MSKRRGKAFEKWGGGGMCGINVSNTHQNCGYVSAVDGAKNSRQRAAIFVENVDEAKRAREVARRDDLNDGVGAEVGDAPELTAVRLCAH
jgi:hypothetical protein